MPLFVTWNDDFQEIAEEAGIHRKIKDHRRLRSLLSSTIHFIKICFFFFLLLSKCLLNLSGVEEKKTNEMCA